MDEKFFFPTIRCLINFAGNTHIAEKMGNQQIFRVVLDKLGQTTEKASTGNYNFKSITEGHS